jgi:hypothetical protein
MLDHCNGTLPSRWRWLRLRESWSCVVCKAAGKSTRAAAPRRSSAVHSFIASRCRTKQFANRTLLSTPWQVLCTGSRSFTSRKTCAVTRSSVNTSRTTRADSLQRQLPQNSWLPRPTTPLTLALQGCNRLSLASDIYSKRNSNNDPTEDTSHCNLAAEPPTF